MAPRLTKPTISSLRPSGAAESDQIGDIIDVVSAATAEYVDKRLGEFKKYFADAIDNVRNKTLTETEAQLGTTFQKTLNDNIQQLEGNTNKALSQFEQKALGAVYGVLDRELGTRVGPMARLKVEEEIARHKKVLTEGLGKAGELEQLINDANGMVGGMVNTAMEKNFGDRLNVLFKSFNADLAATKMHEEQERGKEIEAHRTELKSLQENYKALQESYSKLLTDQRRETDSLLKKQAEEYSKRLVDMKTYCDSRIEDMKKCYEGILNDLKGVVSSIPAPHIDVHVPQGEAPTVNNYIPPDAIKVAVEQAKADVHIHTPEQLAPIVNVKVEPARKTSKSIAYDQWGRPDKIIEEEIPSSKEK